jgi:hypothetical protein
MLKMPSGRFDHDVGGTSDFPAAHITPFCVVSSLNRQHASQAPGFAAVVTTTTVLIGEWPGLPLSRAGLGLRRHKTRGGLCPAALGLALMRPRKGLHFALAVSLVVAAIAALDPFRVKLGTTAGLFRALVRGSETAISSPSPGDDDCRRTLRSYVRDRFGAAPTPPNPRSGPLMALEDSTSPIVRTIS